MTSSSLRIRDAAMRIAATILMLAAHGEQLRAQAASAALQAATSAGTEAVLNEPYSAKTYFSSIRANPDGTVTREESHGAEARDAQGRTYSAGERHWSYKEGGEIKLGTEVLFKVSDPVAKSETRWDSRGRKASVIHWQQSKPMAPTRTGPCKCSQMRNDLTGRNIPRIALELDGDDDDFYSFEQLGTKTVSGIQVRGIRRTYTTRRPNKEGQAAKVVHED